MYPFCSEK